MFNQRENINEVFTPRNPHVNAEMYIQRDEIEKSLYRSVLGSMHTFLFGESGNGKSWMYKKVLSDKNISYVVANCASASRNKSITNEIFSVIVNHDKARKTGYTEVKKAGIKAVVTSELSHQGEYEIIQKDNLLLAFEELSKKSNRKKSIIVLDNVETIIKNSELMEELSDIIILLDDERYAKYKVKFLLVGVPNEVIQYFTSVKNPTSVGNRIEEVPRVTGLNYKQVLELVERGFIKHLKVDLSETERKRLSLHIFNITLGVPQRIHEYCENLGYLIEDNNWEYSHDLLDDADRGWLLKGLRESYAVVDGYFNSKDTSVIRRNQVIYSIGKLATHQVDTIKIANVIEKEFPDNSPESNSGIGQILASLSKGSNPILKKNNNNSSNYIVREPRHLMCMRLVLFIDPITKQIKKKDFKLN